MHDMSVMDPAILTGLLTTAQVARNLHLTREAVCLAVRQGKVQPMMKLPGRNGAYLFTEEAVIEWRSPGEKLAL